MRRNDKLPPKREKKNWDVTIWTCPSCASKRGYRVPPSNEGHVHTAVENCAYCTHRTLCLDQDDMLPPWE